MVNFSCADFTFPTLPHEKAFQVISLMGFKYVDLGLFKDRSHVQPADQLDLPEKRGAAVKQLAADQGLIIDDVFLQSSLDAAEFAINHPDEKIRKDERDKFQRLVDYALAAGSHHLTCLPGCEFNEDSRKLSIEELSWRADYAAQHDVVYSIEPHIGSIMGDPAVCRAMTEEVKGLTLALDYSHFWSQGYSMEQINALVKYASTIHARGSAVGKAQTPFELSTVDFGQMCEEIKRVGYNGCICMEYCYLGWEGLNRTDNISETMKLRQHLADFLGIDVLRTDYTCG